MDWTTVDFDGIGENLTGATGLLVTLIPAAISVFAVLLAVRMAPRIIKLFVR